MTIGNVSTLAQSQYMLSRIQQDEAALQNTQTQVATGYVSTTYGGIGDQTAALESAQTQGNLATGYASAAQLASNQVNLQDAQLSQLSSLASQLQQDLTTAVANGNGGTLMAQAQSVFEQAVQILNSQDANGNYIYSGGNSTTPPVSTTTLAQLMALPSAAQAFTNGTQSTSVKVGENQTVQVNVLASNVGTQLMQTLQDIANFNAGANGNFGTQLTSAQTSFLTNEIPSAQTASQTINQASGSNGEVYQELQAALTQQQSMSTLYQGFASDIQDVDMATASTNLSENQSALQAALEVTAQMGQLSLLNYLPTTTSAGG
ncbi:MAG TPA: flagellin [Rhizomicrobium sp.]|nr:flagellin [Rhizomicrobium sp.]